MHLLDSNILIYAAQEEFRFLDRWIGSSGAQLSAISIPEIFGFSGLSASTEALFESWLATLPVHPVNEATLRKAGALRQSRRMKLGDAILAATALLLDAELITRNERDFQHIPDLRVVDPFEARAL